MIRTFFTHGCNAAMALLLVGWMAGAAAGAWAAEVGPALLGGAIFIAGEYGFHRYVLHAPLAREGSRVRRLQRRLHYDHHAEPSRLELLFLPSWMLAANLALTVGLGWMLWARPAAVGSLVVGVVAATLAYEWTHYVAHIAYRPRTAWGRRIKKDHLWHHFRDARTRFGVTQPGLDLLMGTYGADERPGGGRVRAGR
jgi:sterol desaturase/sphingolipid hydroxylase (fatty acid hydroxylase superfamily)